MCLKLDINHSGTNRITSTRETSNLIRVDPDRTTKIGHLDS